MDFTVGEIVEGKVKSITNFGAFISLAGNRTGMVHISEIAHTYVSDIRQHLTEGQDVKVMILSAEPNGKINLSIKKTLAPPERSSMPPRRYGEARGEGRRDAPSARPENQDGRSAAPRPQQRPARPAEASFSRAGTPPREQSFEDKLKQFMNESDSKLSSVRQYSEHKTKTRRR